MRWRRTTLTTLAALGVLIAGCTNVPKGSTMSDAEFCSQAGDFLVDGWNVSNPVVTVSDAESGDGTVGTAVYCSFRGDDFHGGLMLLRTDAAYRTPAGKSDDVQVGILSVDVASRDGRTPQFFIKIGGWRGQLTLLSTVPGLPATDAQIDAAARALVDAVNLVAD